MKTEFAITFENYNPAEETGHGGDLKENALRTLQNTVEYLRECMQVEDSGGDVNEYDDDRPDFTSLNEYGLSFEAVYNEQNGVCMYLRFLISWGDPSTEVRFHPEGRIEYVHLDWYTGIGFDVSDSPEFEFLKLQMIYDEEMQFARFEE